MSISKDIIKQCLIGKQREIDEAEIISRPIEFEPNGNYVIVGVRHAGKSYMLYQRVRQLQAEGKGWDEILFIDFEDERLAEFQTEDFEQLLEAHLELYGKKPVVFLDEVQNIPYWDKFVRRLADAKYRVYVTGSNAKMLSSEIASTLGGRFVIREIWPFSFREYLAYRGLALEKNWQYDSTTLHEIARRMEEYFYFGGFAEAFDLVDKREWINSLYQKILMGDTIARHGIRNTRSIRLLAKKLADSVMQPTALSRLQNIIKSSGEKIGLDTVKDYLQYFEESYLTFSLPNFVSPITDQETIKKRYYADNGLLNIFLFNGETKLLENLCAIHLMKQFGNTDEPHLFYYNRNIEVDFYVPEAGVAVQASYDINDDETRRREISALVSLNKVFPLKKAIIVTRDHEEQIEELGLTIEVVPIWKWLLD